MELYLMNVAENLLMRQTRYHAVSIAWSIGCLSIRNITLR